MKLVIERNIPHIVTRIKPSPRVKLFKKYEFIDLSTSGKIPKILINNSFLNYETVLINNNDKAKEMVEIFEYLYENGGIYIQNLKCSPDIFIKNNEMIVYNIHYFSCIKNSPIMKKILNDIQKSPLTMTNIINIFNRNTENVFKFNKSLSFLL
jgi:hypothetical protein